MIGLKSRLIQRTLFSATLVMILGNMLGRLTGFAREATIASYFGTSSDLDIFILAFTVPELLAMVLFTAMPAALIPVSKREKGREAGPLFWTGLVWFGLVFGLIALLVAQFRGLLFELLSPGASASEAQTGSNILLLLSPYLLIRGLEVYFRSWCFAGRQFVSSALSNAIMNGVVIAAIFIWYEQIGVESLGYGWLCGSLALLLFNGLFAFAVVKPGSPRAFDWPRTWLLSGSLALLVLIEFVSMFQPVIDRGLAARFLDEGAISSLRYAGALIAIPSGIFVAAFNIASFPWISELVAQNKRERLRQLYIESIRMLVYLMSLVAVGVILFAPEIIMVALMRGQFDSSSVSLTVGPLVYYACGTMFLSIYTFQMRFYYAERRYLRLGVILFALILIKLISSWLLVQPMAQEGLALATSITWLCGMVIITTDLAGQVKVTWLQLFWPFGPRLIVSLLFPVVTWLLLDRLWVCDTGTPLSHSAYKLALAGAVGLLAHYIGGRVMGLAEPKVALGRLRRDSVAPAE